MKQAMIIKIKKSYAIVLTDENTYVRIKVKDHMSLGQKIYFLESDVLSTTKERTMKKKIVAIAAVAAVLMLSIIGVNLMPTSAYALVSIDINPSIDLKIDEGHNVVEIIPLNEEAEDIYTDDMIGQPVMDVLESIIENAQIEKYLTDENNNILISSAVLDDDSLEDLGDLITSHLENDMKVPSNIRVLYIESDKETAEKSLENNVSLGKLELTKITKDEKTVEKTVTEIVEDEEVDLELAENVVIEDDDLAESLQTFISKLRVAPVEEESDLYNFLKLFDENNLPIQEDADLKAYLVLAKTYWKPLMHDYQKTWAQTQVDEEDDADEEDDEDGDEELQESLDEFVGKLRLMAPEFAEGSDEANAIKQWLSDYDAGNHEFSKLELKNQARDLVNEYKQGMQYLWDDDEDDEDKDDDDEKFSEGDLKDLNEFLDHLETYPEMAQFVQQARSEINTATQERLQELKDEAKGYFMSYKEQKRNDWDSDLEEIIEELDELVEEYGDVDGVQTFVDGIQAELDGDSPDLEAIEDRIDDFKDTLEDDKGQKKGQDDDDAINNDDDDDDDDAINNDDDDDDDDDDNDDDDNDDDDNDDDDNHKGNQGKGNND